MVLHKGALGEVYNLGTSKELSTLDVLRSVCAHFGLDANAAAEFVEDRLYNDRRRVCAHTRARAATRLWRSPDATFCLSCTLLRRPPCGRRYFISSAKLNALGWDVRTSWEAGLAKTVAWYEKNVLRGSYWPHYEVALVAHPYAGKSLEALGSP